MIKARRLRNVVIFLETTLNFLPSRKIINIYNDLAQKYGNAAVKDFRKYEKLEYKMNKLKLDIDFLNKYKANNLMCIQNSLSLNSRMFQIKMLHQFVKDSFCHQ